MNAVDETQSDRVEVPLLADWTRTTLEKPTDEQILSLELERNRLSKLWLEMRKEIESMNRESGAVYELLSAAETAYINAMKEKYLS